MKYIFNGLEKIILVLSVICVLVLLNIQMFSYNDNCFIYTSKINKINEHLPFDKTKENKRGKVVLKNMTTDYKEVEILLNGNSIGNFLNNSEISFYVYHNDIIEVDATKYNRDVIIKIINVSDNVELPKMNTLLTISRNIEFLGKIQLK